MGFIKNVVIRTPDGTRLRIVRAREADVGVQFPGDSTTDAMVAIAMSNGKADLYKSSGLLVRRG